MKESNENIIPFKETTEPSYYEKRMKVIYNIQVEKNISESEEKWLTEHNIITSEELTKHISTNEDAIDSILCDLDADKLLSFKAEIIK